MCFLVIYLCIVFFLFFFFFQAEDGIRDLTVTGVQTCALPISALEQDKLAAEYRETMDKIVDLADILAKPARVTSIISDELAEIKKAYGDARDRKSVV